MDPKISVVIPVFRVEKFLSHCIETVLAQTYTNIEVILVDDGSPDKCGELCDEWAKRDNRIKVIHKENGGLSDARNRGLMIATGEYISFIDSDDWVEPDFLQTLYETMQETNSDIVECGVAFVRENGQIIRERVIEETVEILDKIQALKKLVLEDEVYQTVWNKLYKKEVVEGCFFPVGRCNEDDFWTYRIIDRSCCYAIINKISYFYVQRDNSIMGQRYSLKRLDGLDARFERMQYLQKYEILAKFVAEQFQYDCMYHLQNVIKFLAGNDQKAAIGIVIDKLSRTPVVKRKDSCISYKYRIWFALFRKWPCLIAKFRNRIGIGF